MTETAEKPTRELSKAQQQRLEIAKSMGISEECLPPITGRKLAIYHSYEPGGKDPLVKEFQYADILMPSTILDGTYSFDDPYEKNLYQRSKLMKNVARISRTPEVDGAGRPTGKSNITEEIEPVIFDGGSLIVNIENQFGLYVWLELHPLNKTGKFRRANANYAFYRHDLSIKGKGVRNVESDLGLDAALEVRNMKDSKKLLALAAGVPGGAINLQNTNPNDVRRELQDWAQRNPLAFYKLIEKSSVITRLTVAKALDMGIIEYRPGNQDFTMQGDTIFFTPDKADQNPVEALVTYLDKTQSAANMLEQMTGYWD